MTKQPEGLAPVERYLVKELKDRKAGGEDCRHCGGKGSFCHWQRGVYADHDCPICNGAGKSPAITQAEEALKACRDAIERERLVREHVKEYSGTDCDECRHNSQLLAILNAPPVESEAQGGGGCE